MSFRGILFDLGSTLIEFDNTEWDKLEKACVQKGYEFLAQRGYKLPDWETFGKIFLTEFHQAWQNAQESLVEVKLPEWVSNFLIRYGISSPDGFGLEFLRHYYEPISKQITLIEGAKEVLEQFKDLDLKIGLISNSSFPTEFHIEELKNYQIMDLFEETLFSYDFGLRKPHPDLFKYVLNKLDLKPQETVFIGDRLVEDIGGAQKVGMKAILKFKKDRDYSAPVVPDYVINRLPELPTVIQKLK